MQNVFVNNGGENLFQEEKENNGGKILICFFFFVVVELLTNKACTHSDKVLFSINFEINLKSYLHLFTVVCVYDCGNKNSCIRHLIPEI